MKAEIKYTAQRWLTISNLVASVMLEFNPTRNPGSQCTPLGYELVLTILTFRSKHCCGTSFCSTFLKMQTLKWYKTAQKFHKTQDLSKKKKKRYSCIMAWSCLHQPEWPKINESINTVTNCSMNLWPIRYALKPGSFRQILICMLCHSIQNRLYTLLNFSNIKVIVEVLRQLFKNVA